MNRDADLRALRATNPLKRKRDKNNSSASEEVVPAKQTAHSTQNGNMHESDSDVPVSSGQWPPSPDRNQLPPDSSLASADHSDHAKTEAMALFTPEEDTRTLAKTSVVSSPILSTQPSPTSAPRPSRNAVEASPSIVSNSASEETQQFACQAIGCEKTYDNGAALKFHIEFRHSDKGSAQNFKCEMKDCHKSYPNLSGLNYHLRLCHNVKRPGTPDNQIETSISRRSRISTSRSPKKSSVESHNSDLAIDTREGQVKSSKNGIHGPRESRAISPDSDLEVLTANPLNGNRDSSRNTAPLRGAPSTASQPEFPFTQVKRTPYPNGQNGLDRQSSPSKFEMHYQPNSSLPSGTSHLTLSFPSSMEAPSTKTHPDDINGTLTDPRTSKSNQNPGDTQSDKLSSAEQVDMSKQLMSDKGQNLSDFQSSTVNSADDADFPSRDMNFMAPTNRKSVEIETSHSPHVNRDGKRKDPDASFLSPNISKRRKRYKAPSTFDFTGELEHPRDPSEGARQIRQEFLASRRSSESSTPMQSPTTHLNGRTRGTCPSVEKSPAEIQTTNAYAGAPDTLDIADKPGQQIPAGSKKRYYVDQDSELEVEICSVKHARQVPQQLDLEIDATPTVVQDFSTGVKSSFEDAKAGAQEREPTAEPSDAKVSQVHAIELNEAMHSVSPAHDDEKAEAPAEAALPSPQSSEEDRNEPEPDTHDQASTEKGKGSSVRDLETSSKADLPEDAASMQPVLAVSQPTRGGHTTPHPTSTSDDQAEATTKHIGDVSLEVSMPDAEQTMQPTTAKPPAAIENAPPLTPKNTYDRFKAAYPRYSGDLRHFVAICRKISNLVKANQMLHQSLWDDFIIRHKIEYAQYLNRCAEDAEDALPFEEFYRIEIEEPLYDSRVVTRRNLEEVLSLLPRELSAKHVQTQLGRGSEARTQFDNSKLFSKPAHTANGLSKSPRIREKIDLTGEDRQPRRANSLGNAFGISPIGNKLKTRRSLPWSKREREPVSNSSPNSLQHSQLKNSTDASKTNSSLVDSDSSDSSDSETTILPTFSGVKGGPAKSKAQRKRERMIKYESRIKSCWKIRPVDVLDRKYFNKLGKQQLKLLSHIARSVSLEEGRRLLKEHIHGRIARNPEGAMPRMMNVDLEAVRDVTNDRKLATPSRSKMAIHADNPRLAGFRSSKGGLNNYEIKIQVAWGTKPENILEPSYYDEKTLSPRAVQLMAEIADSISVHEARDLIMAQIDTRKTHEMSRGFRPDSSTKMTTEDLENVKKTLSERNIENPGARARNTRRMSFTSPLSLPHTNVPDGKRYDLEPREWFRDYHSPFKTFARAYASIRPGNGNSFSGSESKELVHAGNTLGIGRFAVQLKRLDILNWKL